MNIPNEVLALLESEKIENPTLTKKYGLPFPYGIGINDYPPKYWYKLCDYKEYFRLNGIKEHDYVSVNIAMLEGNIKLTDEQKDEYLFLLPLYESGNIFGNYKLFVKIANQLRSPNYKL